MNKPNPENQGRRCEATQWEMVQVISGDLTKGSDESRAMLLDGLLQPPDKEMINLAGRLYSRHQCQRCGLAILRATSVAPHKSPTFIDKSGRECNTSHGQQVIKRYPPTPKRPNRY